MGRVDDDQVGVVVLDQPGERGVDPLLDGAAAAAVERPQRRDRPALVRARGRVEARVGERVLDARHGLDRRHVVGDDEQHVVTVGLEAASQLGGARAHAEDVADDHDDPRHRPVRRLAHGHRGR